MPFWLGGMFMVHLPLMSRFLRPWKASSILGLKRCRIHHNRDDHHRRVHLTELLRNTEDCIGAQSRGLLLWRSTMQVVGRHGVIMLSMVVLPRFGGGMALAGAN